MAAGTELGQAASAYLERGDLVPDELVIEMLSAPVLEAAQGGGYVLDGFPRTVRQAEEAYRIAQQFDGIELQAVVHLDVQPRGAAPAAAGPGRPARAAATTTRPPSPTGLDVYESETRPMLDFYGGRGIVCDIDGNQSVDDVYTAIVDAVEGHRVGRR